MLRPEVLLALILWEDADVIAKSKQIFNQFLNDKKETIPPNLREVNIIEYKSLILSTYISCKMQV